MAEVHYVFPAEAELRQRWREEMAAYNNYLGEKTEATIVEWLAGKTMSHYDLIPVYALHDYHAYLIKGGSMNGMAKMMLDMTSKADLEAMQAALGRIATRVVQ